MTCCLSAHGNLKIFIPLPSRNSQGWAFPLVVSRPYMGLFTTICRQTAKPYFFAETHRPKPSKAKVHSQFNHGSRKTGQAAGAGGLKQDRYVGPCLCDLHLCVCLCRMVR